MLKILFSWKILTFPPTKSKSSIPLFSRALSNVSRHHAWLYTEVCISLIIHLSMNIHLNCQFFRLVKASLDIPQRMGSGRIASYCLFVGRVVTPFPRPLLFCIIYRKVIFITSFWKKIWRHQRFLFFLHIPFREVLMSIWHQWNVCHRWFLTQTKVKVGSLTRPTTEANPHFRRRTDLRLTSQSPITLVMFCGIVCC